MPRCWLLCLIMLTAETGTAPGQAVPPLALPYDCPRPGLSRIFVASVSHNSADSGRLSGLPNGQTVSQPLQPVILPDSSADSATTGTMAPGVMPSYEIAAVGVLPNFWYDWEYLLWWPEAPRMPHLHLRGTVEPAFAALFPQRSLGGATWNSPESSGGRFTTGFSLGESRWLGLQATYMFLGTRSLVQQGIDLDREDSVSGINRRPSLGVIALALSSRVSGWEIGTVTALHQGPGLCVRALSGYRYFQVHEGLRLDQTRLGMDPSGTIHGAWWQTADQIDGHNRFHGGQFGLHTEIGSGPVLLEMTGKIAIGQSVGVIRRSGWSLGSLPTMPGLVLPLRNQGILVPAGAAGRWQQREFAVLPEATMKFSYRFASQSRFYFGYNFLYLSEVFRPGDQVEAVADLSGIIMAIPAGERLGPYVRGLLLPERSDYWVQGLIFGLEYRY